MASSKVLSNNFQSQWAQLGERLQEVFAKVGASGWYILGPEVAQFEKNLARYWKMDHSIGVANGTDAIEIALRALDLQAGDEVLTTPLSAFATTLAVIRCGGVPVFCDTDECGLIDLDQAEAYFSANSQCRFFLPVHLYGASLDMDRLRKIKEKFNLKIVEDCAQSIDATWKGQLTGSVGQISTTSFYPTKNLGALGDAGAILTNDARLADYCRALRNYGETGEKYHHDFFGLNSRLDEIHAALLNAVMLPELPKLIERRREIAAQYLGGIRNPALRMLAPKSYENPNWHLFPLYLEPNQVASLSGHLTAKNIQWGRHYPRLIPHQKALLEFKTKIEGELRVSQRVAEGELSLPIHPFLTPTEIDRVIEAVNSWKA